MIGRNRKCLAAAAMATVCLTLFMSPALGEDEASDGPVLKDDKLIYPEGAGIPRFETPIERRYADEHDLRGNRGETPPPTGPIDCPAEYEPMEAVMFAYEGYGSWKDILDQMAAEITTTGDADAYVMCDTFAEVSELNTYMGAAGADMSRVHPMVVTTDSIWIRDYGPRYIYIDDVRAIVDHTYNRPSRVNDNQIPSFFAQQRGHAYYKLPLVHGGGNFHLDALGNSNTTRLINNENPALTEQEIHDIWADYQNVDTTFFQPFPTYVDATQHIDMWMQVIGDNAIMISDWPYDSGSIQDNICDGAAADFASAGWDVHRVPARSVSGDHYTYTNVVMCNDVVLVPSYTNPQVTQHNSEANSAWSDALPSKTIVQINCENIVWAAGVMHCIMMHVPAAKGGENPTAYLQNLNGGQTLTPGDTVTINWLSDDNDAVTDVDILLSTDNGATFDTTLVSGTPDDGAYNWQVPDVYASDARLRVVVHDNDGNTGFDDSDGAFVIDGATTASDIAEPFGVVNVFDLLELLAGWGTDGAGADIAEPTDVVDVFDLLQMLSDWG